jgi:hypothetical protein
LRGLREGRRKLSNDLTLSRIDARIVHILHDEAIVEARMDEAVAVGEIVRRSMEGRLRRCCRIAIWGEDGGKGEVRGGCNEISVAKIQAAKC